MKNPQGTPQQQVEKDQLHELLEETRILLPGTQVVGAFLISVPFTQRFGELTSVQKEVFVATFVTTFLAILCFVFPAAYHRRARPIHHKRSFKVLANGFLVAGLVPLSISVVLSAWLTTSMVVGQTWALAIGGAVGVIILVTWWLLPAIRVHERLMTPDERDQN
jgi:hypothetical protein